MRNLLQKSLSKYFLLILFAILIIVIPAIFINIFLSHSKSKIENTLSDYLNQKVSIEKINYLPFNSIVLKNVYFLPQALSFDYSPLSIERIKIRFSLSKLIFKRNLQISKVHLNQPKLDFSQPIFFIQFDIAQIIEALDYFVKDKPFRIVAKSALLMVPQQQAETLCIRLDSIVEIEPNKIISSDGSIGLHLLSGDKGFSKKIAKSNIEPLQYRFGGYVRKDGMAIDSLEFRRGDFYLKLWGKLEKNILKLNGLSSISNFYSVSYQKEITGIIDRFKKILRHPRKPSPQILGLSRSSLDIFDLDCVIKFVYQNIQIEKVSFSLNNIPFCLQGCISLIHPTKIHIKFSSFPDQSMPARLDNPERFDMELAGFLQRGKFNGKISIDFVRKSKTKKSLERAETVVENLAFYFPRRNHLKMLCDKVDLYYKASSNLYKIFFRNFDILFNLENERFKPLTFSSIIYDGFLEGRGLLDVGQMPLRCFFNLKIENVSANELDSLLVYFSRVHGKFNSTMSYKNYPKSNLRGIFVISDGYLDNLIFFKWLAEFFSIPELKKVNFYNLSSDFSANDEVARLENIGLDARGVLLDGYFNLFENDLVSSKLSLVLSNELLEKSPRFNFLLKLLGKDMKGVSFNFQLSGLFDAMNFKWLESDFKTKLKDVLPPGMESAIEKNIEKIIESISSKNTDMKSQ